MLSIDTNHRVYKYIQMCHIIIKHIVGDNMTSHMSVVTLTCYDRSLDVSLQLACKQLVLLENCVYHGDQTLADF